MTADGLESETMHMFVVKNGKVAAFTAFEDTDSIRQSMLTQKSFLHHSLVVLTRLRRVAI